MKTIAICIALFAAACTRPAPYVSDQPRYPAYVPPPPPPNLAILFVTAVEPDARCTAYYTNETSQHVSSAVCRMPSKTVIYCSVGTDRDPACTPLNGSKPPPAAQPEPAPIAPSPSPPPKAKK